MTRLKSRLALGAALTLVGTLSAASGAAADTFRFGHVFSKSHPMAVCADQAAAAIAKRTDGRHTVQVYPDSTLGNETALYESMSLGGVDMMYTGAFFAGNAYGPAAIGNAPFAFRDLDHWKAFAWGSDLMKDIAAGFSEKTGNSIIAATYYGTRHVTANTPVKTPADLKGMKIRVPNAPAFVTTFKAFGANPTPLPFAEVYLALQQRVVDAQENPLPTIDAQKFHEVQKYIVLTGHISETQYTIVSNKRWNALSDADKAIFREVFAEAAQTCTEDIAGKEKELVAEFEKRGNQVLAVDRAPFQTVMEPLLASDQFPWGKDAMARLQAIR
ncbi:sialic acid TRAP transporter substrate-binding protein SiaP [Azospirillum sp. ST 5-10]|uniref:sialic acid TRAP transporter substrate-binding protein SiaP n=1 Tax=unclassified Azospirillum TaxID=2630922 RepID=UPI003F4A2DC8